VGASGVVHLHPNQNAAESNHGKLKSGKSRDGILQLSASRSQAANRKLPKMFRVHSRENNGVKVRIPKNIEDMPSSLFHALKLADMSVDVRSHPSKPNAWYVNAAPHLGKAITNKDIEDYHEIVANGNVHHFQRDTTACFAANERLCLVMKRNDGTCIGSCDVCSKKLGCLGAWLI